VETMHVGNSRGETENALNLSQDVLVKREVVPIDIVNDPLDNKYYKEDQDPTKYQSKKTGRGPLKDKWIENCDPVMTCYKLVTCEFKWFGLQSRVESFILNTMRALFTKTHRQLFCLTDAWCDLTMDDIRKLEVETQQHLDEKRRLAGLSGSKAH